MTSDSDNTPRRRPPTIDLTATEVEAETAPAAPEAGAESAHGDADQRNAASERAPSSFAHRIGRLWPRPAHAIGAFAGAVVMMAICAGLWLAGLLPPQRGPPPTGAAPEAAASRELAARLDKVEAALAAPRPDASLATRVTAAEAETKSLDNSLAALNRRLDGIAVTVGNAQARADAAVVAAEAARNAAQAGAPRSDLDALAVRTAALERSARALSEDVERRTASADDRIARTAVVAAALRATVERGAPYEAELAALKSLGVAETALAPLQPFAAKGVPSAAALASELATLRPALLQASVPARRDGSFLGRLQANAEKLVRISPMDAPQGAEASAVIGRVDADAARADIAAALADIDRLPDAERALAEPWIKKASARETAVAASRRIAADALAALDKPASQ